MQVAAPVTLVTPVTGRHADAEERPEPTREELEALRGISDLETYHAHCRVCAEYLKESGR